MSRTESQQPLASTATRAQRPDDAARPGGGLGRLLWHMALAGGLLFMGWDISRAADIRPAEPVAIDAAALFKQHCAACHGAQRLGGMGPALLPESLERLRPAEAAKVIRLGRDATQMPAFGETAPGEGGAAWQAQRGRDRRSR